MKFKPSYSSQWAQAGIDELRWNGIEFESGESDGHSTQHRIVAELEEPRRWIPFSHERSEDCEQCRVDGAPERREMKLSVQNS